MVSLRGNRPAIGDAKKYLRNLTVQLTETERDSILASQDNTLDQARFRYQANPAIRRDRYKFRSDQVPDETEKQ